MSLSTTPCTHCGLPVAAGRGRASEDEVCAPGQDAPQVFCCRGCRVAHAFIVAGGLQDYYRLADGQLQRAATGDRRLRYAELDRPEILAAHSEVVGPGERTATLAIEGLHCAACIWLLERLPRVVPGVAAARVDWRRSTIEVRWEEARTSLATIAEGIARLGYRPHLLRPEAGQDRRREEERRYLVAIAVAFAAAGNNMLIAGSLYLGAFSYMGEATQQLLRLASCVVGLVSVLGPGRIFFRGAWSAIRSRTPHMDLPVALGLAVGAIAGAIDAARGSGELYFDTLSVLVFLLLVGRWLQARQQRHAAATLEVLYRVAPRIAHKRIDDGTVADVPAQVLLPGDVVVVAAGETIPGDGVIVQGRSRVDQQVLTGEARPIAVAVGGRVAAGTLNLGARLEIEIEAVGENTRMGRVLALVERSGQRRPAIVQLADRIGAWFVIGVLGLAGATLVGWLAVEPGVAVDHAVALLIVACPCALALATPLAVAVGIGRAARRKILIKGGDVLQRLAQPGTIWLDKTGTLTRGEMAVVGFSGDRRVAAWVTAVEQHSAHPIAVALSELDAGPSEVEVSEVDAAVRGGISARVRTPSGETHRIAIGNASFVGVDEHAAELARQLRDAVADFVAAGASPVYVALEGRVVAVAGVGDPLREDAAPAVAELQRQGWTVGILSGDHPDVVAAVGARLGLPAERCHGGLLPEDKVAIVDTPAQGTVVMVGDGVNDSAALAAAGVGIATHEGAEASLQAAPVYLGRPGLSGLTELLAASRATMRAIRRNFAISLAYNALSVGLAAAGVIGPLLAAVLMPLSSVSVVLASMSIRWEAPR